MDWVSGRSSVPDLAQQRHGADCQKPTLRFGLWQRLMPGVRRTPNTFVRKSLTPIDSKEGLT